jgi:hypothetical protein
MTSSSTSFSRQTLYDVARRRMVEARRLLDVPHKACDGAVTCALLAAECALKAVLLHGHQVNTIDDLDETAKRLFRSKEGHMIPRLWDSQSTRAKVQKTNELSLALNRLNCDRYSYRYGGKRPVAKDATPFVEAAQAVVDWMKVIFK